MSKPYLAELPEKALVEIYNSRGELVMTTVPRNLETFIDLNNRPNGIYFLIFKEGNKHLLNYKILKE